jgi:hypothetical protein
MDGFFVCFYFYVALSEKQVRFKKIDFLWSTSHVVFLFKLQLLIYMKMQETKNFGVLGKKKLFSTIGPSNSLRGLTHLWSGSTKKCFLNFCYFLFV